MKKLVPSAEMTLGPFFPREFAQGANDLTRCGARTAAGEVIEITGRITQLDGKPLAAHPTPAQIERVRRAYPEARLMLYLKRGLALANEMKWMGSYRYAVVNLGAASSEDLQAQAHALRRDLFAGADAA